MPYGGADTEKIWVLKTKTVQIKVFQNYSHDFPSASSKFILTYYSICSKSLQTKKKLDFLHIFQNLCNVYFRLKFP